MKKSLEILAILIALGIPMLAQSNYPANRDQDDRGYSAQDQGQYQSRLSPDDQKEFNKEYDRWQKASAKHDRDDIDKHARRMEDIMARNQIPPNTPFDAIATSNGYSNHSDVQQYQGRFSPEDQKKFDKAYEHWTDSRRKNDRDDIAKDEGKMQEIMTKYNIPRDVPYDSLVSGSRGY